ncbi:MULTISPECIES: hypothetical protein [Burkholderia]|uniref:hypothetical protein n=1 Tax=Burkholderia TaxID=32008 RepID=UPI0004129B23|nr:MULTISPECIES: hypothetical protein [Burkholderia]
MALRRHAACAGYWLAKPSSPSNCSVICRASERMVGYCFGDADAGESVVLAILPEDEGACSVHGGVRGPDAGARQIRKAASSCRAMAGLPPAPTCDEDIVCIVAAGCRPCCLAGIRRREESDDDCPRSGIARLR